MIKLIMSDMDGTLLDEEGHLPQEFPAVMERLKAKGVIFAPASGRQYYSLLTSFKDYEQDFIFIAENGTLVKYRGKELSSSPMRKELAYMTLDAMAGDENILSVFCGKKNGYILKRQQRPEFMRELGKYYTASCTVEDFPSVDDEPIKISFFDPAGRAAHSIYPKLTHFNGPLQVTLSSDYWVDIMAFGISKGIAIQQIQKRLKITPMECAAFGDYLNDAEMMSSVYYSYAMANAHPKLKELARFQAASNAKHGVLLTIANLLDRGLCG